VLFYLLFLNLINDFVHNLVDDIMGRIVFNLVDYIIGKVVFNIFLLFFTY